MSLRLPRTLALCLGPFGSGLDKVKIVSARTPGPSEDTEAVCVKQGASKSAADKAVKKLATSGDKPSAGQPAERDNEVLGASADRITDQAPEDASLEDGSVATVDSKALSRQGNERIADGAWAPNEQRSSEHGHEHGHEVVWRHNDVAGNTTSNAQIERFVSAKEELMPDNSSQHAQRKQASR